MPDQYKIAAQDYADKIKKNAEQSAEVANEAYQNYARQSAASQQSVADAYQASIAQTERANALNERAFADMVADIKRQQEQSIKDGNAQEQAARAAATWTGATELASAITNLLGVGYGNAANQQYGNYAANWMQRADDERRRNQQRRDAIRDRQRELQQQMLSLKSGNAANLAQAKLQSANAQANAALQRAEMAYRAAQTNAAVKSKGASDAAAAEYEGEIKAAESADRKDQIARQYARQDAQLEAQMIRQGYKRDDKGNWVVDTNSPQYLAAIAKSADESNGNNRYLFQGTSASGGDEQLAISPSALKNNIQVNMRYWDDMPDKDRRAVERIVEGMSGSNADESVKQMIPYLRGSKKAMAMVRRLAGAADDNDDLANDEVFAPSAAVGRDDNAQSAIDKVLGRR